MKGKGNIYVEETVQKTKQHFDPSNQQLKFCHVSHSIYDSQPPCQSKHDSQELAEVVTPCVRLSYQATDPWSGGATDRGKFQGRLIELTESDFRDEVIRKGGTIGLTKLVDKFATQTEK